MTVAVTGNKLGKLCKEIPYDLGDASGLSAIALQYNPGLVVRERVIRGARHRTHRSNALIADELLEILRCPKDHSPLTRAEPALVERINRAIATGSVTNLAGQKLEKPIDGGLVNDAGNLLYVVLDQIPVLLPDEAVSLEQFEVAGE